MLVEGLSVSGVRIHTVAVLVAALIVLAASLVFAQACGELVQELREARQSAEQRADAATEEARKLNAFLGKLVKLGEDGP